MSKFKTFIKDTIILTMIGVVGAILRIRGIGARSLWFDEALSASFLDFGYRQIVRRCAEPLGAHPPLYFVVMKAWAALAGDSEAVLRGLSAILGLFTIIGVYCFVRVLTCPPWGPSADISRYAATLAAILTALSPMQIELSRTVRGYTLAMTCLVLSGLAVLRAMRGRRGAGYWVASAILSVAACYAHHVAIFSVAAGVAFAGAWLRRKPVLAQNAHETIDAATREAEVRRHHTRWATISLGIFIACYIGPWFPALLAQSETIRRRSFDWPFSVEDASTQIFQALCATYDQEPTEGPVASWSTTALLAALLVYLAARGGWGRRFLFLAGLVPPALMVAFSLGSQRSIFHARYLCFAQLAWLAGAAVVVTDVTNRVARHLLGAYLVAASIFVCHENWSLLGSAAQPGMRGAVRLILDHRVAGEPVVAGSPYVFFGIKYYTRGVSRPLLLAHDPSRSTQIGSEHLRDSDLVAWDHYASSRKAGLWVVISESYDPSSVVSPKIPPHWQLTGKWEFNQDRYWLERPIRVLHYSASEGSAGPPAGNVKVRLESKPSMPRPTGL